MYVRFQLSACIRRRKRRRVFSGYAKVVGFFLGLVSLCVLALLPVWYYGMELTPLSYVLLLLSACSMARGHEETSTSQVVRRRGPGRDTSSTSSIILSLSMEELRSYYHIPDNIDFELPDDPDESTIDEENDEVYFTRGQLTAGLHFLVSSLIKQFQHFPSAACFCPSKYHSDPDRM